MKIIVSQESVNWCKKEMGVNKGDAVRFFVRYAECGDLHDDFLLGISNVTPNDPSITLVVDGITFYVEGMDSWYFEGRHLYVDYNQKIDEKEYTFHPTIVRLAEFIKGV